jgi:hypothetical protein
MNTPEGRLTDRIRRYLKKVPGLYFAKLSGQAKQRAGLPDFIICYEGQFIALEVKAPSNKRGLTDRQRNELLKIKQAGGEAYVARSLTAVIKRFPL